MKALIAGGAGFIGSHLCRLLLAKGFEVICVDNLMTSTLDSIATLMGRKGFHFIKHDIRVPLAIGGIDYVFNLASPASPIHYQKRPIDTLIINGTGIYELLKLAVDNKARFLLASTSEVYGDPKLHPQPEQYWGNVNPVGVRSCYDEGKRFAESLTTAFSNEYSLDTRIVRIFNTYGPFMRPDDGRVIPNFVNQALKGRPMTIYGDGLRTRSLCFIDDLVRGLYLAAISDSIDVKPINIGSGDERTLLELANLIKALVGSSSDLKFLPALEDEPTKRKPDITRAKQALGWEPLTSLEEGLAVTIAWFSELRSLKEETTHEYPR